MRETDRHTQETNREGDQEKERDSNDQITSQNDHNHQDWTRTKPGAQNFIWTCLVGNEGPRGLAIFCMSRCISRATRPWIGVPIWDADVRSVAYHAVPHIQPPSKDFLKAMFYFPKCITRELYQNLSSNNLKLCSMRQPIILCFLFGIQFDEHRILRTSSWQKYLILI